MSARAVSVFGLGLLAAVAGMAQAPAAKPLAFDVASIKPAPPITPAMVQAGKLHAGLSVDGARVDLGFVSLADLIAAAYKVKSHQVSGPSWMSAERWDILAKMPDGATKDDVPQLLQSLLADRFKLTIHKESKEFSVYALVVGKGGPKLKESPPDDPAAKEETASSDGGRSMTLGTGSNQVKMTQNRDGQGMTVSGGQAGKINMSMQNGGMHMEASKMTMAMFAEMIARFVDRPVVDQTELKGTYQVAIDLAMEDLMNVARASGVAVPAGALGGGGAAGAAPAASVSEPGGSIFNSVQQLGLKLEAKKTPTETIVVDHLEKAPTEN